MSICEECQLSVQAILETAHQELIESRKFLDLADSKLNDSMKNLKASMILSFIGLGWFLGSLIFSLSW